MALPTTNDILSVLAAHGIRPLEGDDLETELPGLGQIEAGEMAYQTSIGEVMGDQDQSPDELQGMEPMLPVGQDDPRLWELRDLVARRREEALSATHQHDGPTQKTVRAEPPEPGCAWYCPIHYFGHGWGIYIRESAIISEAKLLVNWVDWKKVKIRDNEAVLQLLRSAFYCFFLHEQFHHKVESLGLRFLVATHSDRYRIYKKKVYSRTYLTSQCLEESLANAESFLRLDEVRYRKRIDPAIRAGLKEFLKWSMEEQPPGYFEGLFYLSNTDYREGLYRQQSQVLDGEIDGMTNPDHWSIAPNVITALADISARLYVIVPSGSRPLFPAAEFDPGATLSSRELESALTRHYGYAPVPGGKGSHVKLSKPGAPTIVLPGNRPVLSPGVVKHALEALGGYPLSRARDLINGTLSAKA